MRYSVLVHLTKMARTLQEAAAYIDTAPDGDSLCPELLSNGVKMLEQIRVTVEQHRDDLCDSVLLEHLSAAEALWDEGGDALQGALEAFAQALPNCVRYQIRAVFFIGLGSTWDAMQSVYEYMCDDPRFDPIIVRMPTLRTIMQNGKLNKTVLYSDFLAPMGIPSLDYHQYHIEADCPEVAFTSQPYENCCSVQFWPENIAKYSRLIYLPYFLPDLVDNTSVEAMARQSVFRFAWKVICSSEKHYKFYCKYAANKGANALVSGLPKTDHLVTLCDREILIRHDWSRLDGKTVILWNSWYDILASSFQYADQLLAWFEAHPDYGLIWRPHPLTDMVTKFQRPEQYDAYQEARWKVQAAKNMILDEDSSYEAAFTVSNAMISDYSSMLPQYLLINKPALWIRTKTFSFTGEKFIDTSWMEQAENVGEIYRFMENIHAGKDPNCELRKMIRQRDLPLADGHCGARVCESIWNDIHAEDGIAQE